MLNSQKKLLNPQKKKPPGKTKNLPFSTSKSRGENGLRDLIGKFLGSSRRKSQGIKGEEIPGNSGRESQGNRGGNPRELGDEIRDEIREEIAGNSGEKTQEFRQEIPRNSGRKSGRKSQKTRGRNPREFREEIPGNLGRKSQEFREESRELSPGVLGAHHAGVLCPHSQ